MHLLRFFVLTLVLLSSLCMASSFTQLTPAEQRILSPLANDWDKLPKVQQEKWQRLAKRYPSLSAEERVRFDERMHGWNKLKPEDRRAAREQFLEMKPNLPPEKRKEALQKQWETYQKLPPEKQAEYRAKAEAKAADSTEAKAGQAKQVK